MKSVTATQQRTSARSSRERCSTHQPEHRSSLASASASDAAQEPSGAAAVPDPSAVTCADLEEHGGVAKPPPASKGGRPFSIRVVVRGGQVLGTGSADVSLDATMDAHHAMTVHSGTTIISIKESLLHCFGAQVPRPSGPYPTASDLRLRAWASDKELWDGSPDELPACETAICDFDIDEGDRLVLSLA